MEGFRHVLNTWLVAQLVHFIIYACLMIWVWGDFSIAPLIVAFSFFFSISGYFLSAYAFKNLCRLKVPMLPKFLLWLIIMSLCIVVGVFLTSLFLFAYVFFFAMDFLLIPAIAAAIASACIRFRQFNLTVTFLNRESSINNYGNE